MLWRIKIFEFNYKVQYNKCIINTRLEALSRLLNSDGKVRKAEIDLASYAPKTARARVALTSEPIAYLKSQPVTPAHDHSRLCDHHGMNDSVINSYDDLLEDTEATLEGFLTSGGFLMSTINMTGKIAEPYLSCTI